MTAKLVLFFVDGLDHGFLRRNLQHSRFFRHLFLESAIHRIQGDVHSLACLSSILAGRKLDLFEFDETPFPKIDRIFNWDLLLTHVDSSELLWNRMNDLGYRVGLVEMLGIVFSPILDGFSITKGLHLIQLGSVYDEALSHYPPDAAELYLHLRNEYAFPAPHTPGDFRALLTKPLAGCSAAELVELQDRCDYRRMFDVADEHAKSLFFITRKIRQRFPAEVLAFHIGQFDRLLHFYFGFDEEERQIMLLLDRVFGYLKEQIGFEELIVFSDHGMVLSAPHEAGIYFHRACHDADAAVFMTSGPRASRYAAEHPPRDLRDVYHAALFSLDGRARPSRSDP
jgi:hypothetical protein